MKKIAWLLVLVFLMSMSCITFAEEEIIELYVGESIPLDTKVVSGEVLKDESDIVWTYSEEGVCSISSNDTITGKKAGKVTVTGNLNKGGTILEVKFDVLVKNTVKSVSIVTQDQNLRVGETFGIVYNLVPVDLLSVPMNKGVKFKTTDAEVLTVNSSGTVTIVGVGEAYVLVESTEAGKKDNIKVVVEPTVEKVSIDQKSQKIYVGEQFQMTVTYSPLSGKSIFLNESEWKSFDTSVVSVDSKGLITGKKKGSAAVRATSKDNKKESTVSIEVLNGVKSVEITENLVELSESYKTHQLTAVITPVSGLSEPFEKGLTWKSSDSNICSISSSGVLTAKKTGSVTITVETKDGGFKDYSGVKVSMPTTTTDPNIKISNITFNMSNTKVKVGEKIPLEYTVTPENASRSSLKFTVRSSGYGKIEKENDVYYYTALKDGVTFVDAYADGNKYDETLIFADTMLNGFAISESNLEKEYGTNVIYLGQKMQLKPDFDMAIGDYPLLDEVKYTSSDTKILKIVDGDYIEGVTLGNVNVKGVTSDNGFEDSANFKVISNIKAVESEKSARIGIDMPYEPTVNFIPIEKPFYDLNTVLMKDYTLELEKVKVSATFVQKEIDYSKIRKSELDTLIDNRSGDLNENLSELQKCHQRLFDYETVYKTKSGDYCDTSVIDRQLKDRNYNDLKIAEIKSNKLYAYIVSEIDLKVVSKDPKVFTTITVSVEDNVSSIVIFDENGEVITASVENLLNHYTDDVLFANNPSSWAVDHIKLANTKGLLVDEVIDDYQAYITREEFIELVMNFYNVELGFPELSQGIDVFDDTNNSNVLKAYELGIISGRGPGKFAPMDNVTREEMCVILNKALSVMNKTLTDKKSSITFADESSISSWAKEAVDKMTKDHSILSGVGGNTFSPKGNTTKEQAIIVIYKVFDKLK